MAKNAIFGGKLIEKNIPSMEVVVVSCSEDALNHLGLWLAKVNNKMDGTKYRGSQPV